MAETEGIIYMNPLRNLLSEMKELSMIIMKLKYSKIAVFEKVDWVGRTLILDCDVRTLFFSQC